MVTTDNVANANRFMNIAIGGNSTCALLLCRAMWSHFFGIMLAYPKLSMYFYGLKLKIDAIKRDGEKENRAWGYPLS